MKSELSRHDKILLVVFSILLFPALLINLGFMTNIDDESIRALVAMEMTYSGNYITPTLNGEYYYNKPPLFNWILLIWYNLFGNFNEFSARIQTVVALVGFGITVYYSLREKIGQKTALLTAAALITIGRILYMDSLLGLIDITFSWVIYGLFFVVFHEGEKGNRNRLFIMAYFLAAIGFLLKGLPAAVFLGGTLFTYFLVFAKNRKAVFSLAHLFGITIFIAFVGGYYFMYHQQNDLQTVFSTLVTESTKRTPVHYNFGKTIAHLFSFPFEMVYHFLPWSVLSVLFFHKKTYDWIRQNRFISYMVLCFLFNIIVYWISPQVYPRYLFMFIPLYMGVLFYLLEKHIELSTLHSKFIFTLFGILMAIVAVGFIAIPFVSRIDFIENRIPITVLLMALAIPTVMVYYRWETSRILAFSVMLLIIRIGFNLVVLPERNHNDLGNVARQNAIEAGIYFKDKELFVSENIELNITTSYYLSRQLGRIVPYHKGTLQSGNHYIVNLKEYAGPAYEEVLKLTNRHRNQESYHIIKIH